MVKKKAKKKAKKKRKLTLAEKAKYSHLAGYGSGMDYLKAMKMLGGINTKNMGMGPGTHGHPAM